MKTAKDLPKKVAKKHAILFIYSPIVEKIRHDLYACGVIDQLPPIRYINGEIFSIMKHFSEGDNPQKAFGHIKDKLVPYYQESDNAKDFEKLNIVYQ